jgi:glucosyl-3-phosphoglycerate synthase
MRAQVGDWFSRRTVSAYDWSVRSLLAAKGTTRISVVLPALNEARTVGAIVDVIRRGLVERHGLVDELVVMDSGSTDSTIETASAAGARVVCRADVLPAFDPLPGKGEVLWRSLAATTGDIVVFVDSDLDDFDPVYVTGLLGPLLHDPGVAFVKAAYDRPLRIGSATVPSGGGRVTEILARPLINMFWPDLAGVVQPLSGECAARRSLLERLPFATGYGVDIGLLVDTSREVGLNGLAQVELPERRHRNSSNETLGRMAAEILRVVLTRVEQEGQLKLADPLNTALVQFGRVADAHVAVPYEVTQIERPPLATVRGWRGGSR